MQPPRLLHETNLKRIPFVGRSFVKIIRQRVEEVADQSSPKDPDISVLIRSRNNREQLSALIDDIEAQDYDGKIEVIVVDTESTDGAAELAKSRGAKVINISQDDFSYPKSLNIGFKSAKYEWVFSLVDHSALMNDKTFKVAARWNNDKNVAGVYGVNLPNKNATLSERITYGLGQLHKMRRKAYKTTKKDVRGGFMAANNSIIRRSAWSDMGGFDESYGAGGEDFAFGVSLRDAGYDIVFDPALSVYHTHGLNFVRQIQQVFYWYSLSNPLSFDAKRLNRYRPDLRRHQTKD